jgi:hypothetical protein
VPSASDIGPNPGAPNARPLETIQTFKNNSLMHAYHTSVDKSLISTRIKSKAKISLPWESILVTALKFLHDLTIQRMAR